MPDTHVGPSIRMDWRKMTKTRDSILRMNQTIVYVGFNAVKNIILILRAESPILGSKSGHNGRVPLLTGARVKGSKYG